MNEQSLTQTRQEIEALIVAKAWKDDAYKQKLLSNPKAIFEQELGVELAQEIRIQVLEENFTSLYFVLPVNPMVVFKKIDLSEEELEVVAAGARGTNIISEVIKVSTSIALSASAYAWIKNRVR